MGGSTGKVDDIPRSGGGPKLVLLPGSPPLDVLFGSTDLVDDMPRSWGGAELLLSLELLLLDVLPLSTSGGGSGLGVSTLGSLSLDVSRRYTGQLDNMPRSGGDSEIVLSLE